MEYRSILYKKENAKATITLNRPRALNALNREMIEELLSAIEEASRDPEIRVLILTGAISAAHRLARSEHVWRIVLEVVNAGGLTFARRVVA